MKRSLQTLEALHAALSCASGEATGGSSGNSRNLLEERRIKDAAREHQLAKLPPYKRAEYLCLECVAELRSALRNIEELQCTLHGASPAPSSVSNGRDGVEAVHTLSREEREGESIDDNGSVSDERAQLLGRRGVRNSSGSINTAVQRCRGQQQQQERSAQRTGEAALLEQELLRARQQARRAHQRLLQLQREASRLAGISSSSSFSTRAAVTAGSTSSSYRFGADAGTSAEPALPPSSTEAVETSDWPCAEKHIEFAKMWYRELFGIYTVCSSSIIAGALGVGVRSSLSSSALQLNRPAQPLFSAGSIEYYGNAANSPPSGIATSNGGDVSSYSGSPLWKGADRKATAPSNINDDGGSTRPSTPSQALMFSSAREDAEFREFFASVQVNDDLMDAALDRISDGVARLLGNARGLQGELVIQEELLQGTETRIDQNEVAIANMNRRLRRAIRDMNDSSVCVYVLCLLVLLLILAVLLRVAD